MNIKDFYRNNKNKIVISAIMLSAFAFGYSLPYLRAGRGIAQDNNIGIKIAEQQDVKTSENLSPTPSPATKKPNPNTKTDSQCPIKGKTSTKGVRMYYMPGSMFYARTKAEKCFTTEDAARKAGYTKSKR